MAKAKTLAIVAKKDTKSSNSPPALRTPYLQMITEAISTLKERNGSSQPAIAKAIESKHGKDLPPNFKKVVSLQLKKLVQSQRLVKVKNSYKLSSSSSNSSSSSSSGRKAVKTKRLSQVKTPEAMKNNKKIINNPQGLKMKNIGSPRPMKKDRK